MSDRSATTRHVPATPALFQRTAMICQVVTQPSDWKIVGTRKSAPHQHSRHTKCRVGDMARQAIILALEERNCGQLHRPLLISPEALVERVEDYSLLRI